MSASHRPKKLVAFDWDIRRVRVVSAAIAKRGPKVDRIVSVAIPADVDITQAAQMGVLLRRILEQEGIGATHAIVDIPRDQAILNVLSLPSQVPDELPAIVSMQIAKQLPFAVGDAVIDFAVNPHPPEAVTADVLVAAVRHDVLKYYEAVFAAAGLKLVRVGLRPYANKVAACELLKHAMPERVVFIDVGPTLTEINVLRNGFLAFSRAASVAVGEDGAAIGRDQDSASMFSIVPGDGASAVRLHDGGRPNADVVATLAQEVTVSIEAYRASDAGAKIDHAIIGGDLGVEEALSEVLQQRLRITAELYNPSSTFGWEPDEGVGASACAATLGLVLGYAQEDALQFDFLHPKKVVSVAEERLRKAPLVAAVAALFLTAGGVGLAAMTKDERARLAAIEQKIVSLQKSTAENQKFLLLVREIRNFDRAQHVWVDVLYDLTQQLPSQEELVINQIELNQKDGKVVLKTRAKRRETATNAVKSLAAFRRDGKEKPRFRATMRAQSEKPGEMYPFSQDLLVELLDDEGKAKRQG